MSSAALSLAKSIEGERIMATKQSSAGRVNSSAASRRLAAAAKEAVERAAEAKKRVRDAKSQLKSLRKLAKLAKKAAKVALKKAQAAAKPAAPARAVPARSAAAGTAKAPTVRASTPKLGRKRTTPKAPLSRRRPAEVARSVIRRMKTDESGHSVPATAPAAPRDGESVQPRLAQPDTGESPQSAAP
jgi:hypothetical protein